MEETYNTTAIVLKNQPYRENDSRVILYSVDKGKLELVARGTKKIKSKLAGHLEPITLVNLMVIRGRQYDYVGTANNIKAYRNIKDDWEKINMAGRAIGVFDKLIKNDEADQEMYIFLEKFFDLLNQGIPAAELFYIAYLLKLLSMLGYQPELYQCQKCKKKILANNKSKFNIINGGLVCSGCFSGCREELTISDNCIKLLRLIIKTDMAEVKKIKAENKLFKEANSLVSSFLNTILNQ